MLCYFFGIFVLPSSLAGFSDHLALYIGENPSWRGVVPG